MGIADPVEILRRLAAGHVELKEEAGRPKDLAVLPVLRATLAETLRRS